MMEAISFCFGWPVGQWFHLLMANGLGTYFSAVADNKLTLSYDMKSYWDSRNSKEIFIEDHSTFDQDKGCMLSILPASFYVLTISIYDFSWLCVGVEVDANISLINAMEQGVLHRAVTVLVADLLCRIIQVVYSSIIFFYLWGHETVNIIATDYIEIQKKYFT